MCVDLEVGCTTNWPNRWTDKEIDGYLHFGYEKMYILFFSDRARCLSDQQLAQLKSWSPEEIQEYKDTDRANGRMEIRLFDLADEHGERRRGFLNTGRGNEGLPKAKPSWCVTYVAVKKKGTLWERFVV